MHLLMQAIWGHIWKHTVEKSQTNVTNVIMHLLMQAIWGRTWKHTVAKSQTNVTNVTLPHLRQATWGLIWKHTVEKSQTDATSVTLHLLWQSIWGDIWKHTVVEGGDKVPISKCWPNSSSVMFIGHIKTYFIFWTFWFGAKNPLRGSNLDFDPPGPPLVTKVAQNGC